MKKFYKKAVTIGLAGILGAASAAALVGCGKNSDQVLSVYIFAGSDDIQTNTDLVHQWGKNYKANMIKNGVWTEGSSPNLDTDAAFDLSFDSDTATYFTTINKKLSAGNAPDIFYVSPKYVKTWSKSNYVLDLSKYIDFADTTYDYNIDDVWADAISFYAYDSVNNVIGEKVTYDKATKTFKNNNTGATTALYGLPKDYSTFGMAYNAKWFSEGANGYKQKYQTTSAASFGDKGVITTLDGKDAPGVINPKQAITYKPYNFYAHDNYAAALAAGDPVAAASNSVGGYTVTIPGFPGETFDVKAEDQDPTAVYDATIGHVVYTYAEYSALSWAATYYIYKESMANGGNGYITNALGDSVHVFANDIHENNTLYLLPWLHGNNTEFINSDYTKVTNATNLDGRTTGIDSDPFIETYAAFVAYSSDWNSNSNFAGASDGVKIGGWDSFCAGASLFYGCGTWDMPSLNAADKSDLDYQLMPEPISESYALYSKIKDAKYQAKEYGTKKATFTDDEWYENQLSRQTVWGARADSVGYGANKKLEEKIGTDGEWKIAACASLVAFLTIDHAAQVSLTYAGSQLPNYASQIESYAKYMDEKYLTDGDFRYMITPDNTADNLNPNNPMSWTDAYALAWTMANTKGKTTVADWMAQNYPNYNYNQNYAEYTMAKVKTVSIAMRVLNMISYNYNSRDIAVRMTSGLNAARDSAMYTYDTEWLNKFCEYKVQYLVGYSEQAVGGFDLVDYGPVVEMSGKFYTPYEYCKYIAPLAQQQLDKVVGQ